MGHAYTTPADGLAAGGFVGPPAEAEAGGCHGASWPAGFAGDEEGTEAACAAHAAAAAQHTRHKHVTTKNLFT